MTDEKRKLTKEEMARLLIDGYSYGEIAKQAGLSRQRVQQLLSPPPTIKAIIRDRYNNCCASCGIHVGSSGHIHHENGNDTVIDNFNNIDNLILLCPSCHRKKHPYPFVITEQSSNLSKIRVKAGISQGELGRLCNIPPPTICALEKGHIIAYPGWRERIAAALGVTEAEIWPEEG